MIHGLLHDLRQGTRSLRRDPSFVALTVLTLGLGVGVFTALFAVTEAVLLRPMAVEQDRVVRVWKQDTERGLTRHPLSYPEYRDWRAQSRSFSALAAINYADGWDGAIVVDGEPVRVSVMPVSSPFFAAMHPGPPRHGRWLEEVDERKGAELVGVVSDRLWRRIASGDPGLVGRRVTLAGGEWTLLVVGIAPPELDYPLGTDIWVPIASFLGRLTSFKEDVVESRSFALFELLGRLAPGVSVDAAQAELAVIERRTAALDPERPKPMPVVVKPVLDTLVGSGRPVLLFLFAAAGLVFVIAGANVAALLLMRASRRRSELAVRIALGASRARLARQTMAESLLLALFGGLAGVLLAQVFLAVLRWLAPSDLPRVENAAVGLGVAGFCAFTAMVWVLGFGSAPVWGQSRLHVAPGERSLEATARTVRGSGSLRLFTVAEIAAAVVVAIGAGLLVRSFVHLQGLDRGVDGRNVAVLSLLLPQSRYPDAAARVAFYERLLPRVMALPGVVAAAPVHLEPGSGVVGLNAGMRFEGQTTEEAAKNPWATWEPVLPSYFRTLGVPILRGRGFTDADRSEGARVAIVSEAVARRYWPGQDPIGRHVKFTSDSPWATVVGVAADHRYRELTREWLTVYFPAPQLFFFSPSALVVRTAVPPDTLAAALRRTIRAEEPHVPLESFTTMEALFARELSRPRTAFAVTALFALMAVVLATVGVYGVTAYEVSRQSREMAVRSALGASPGVIFRTVIRRGLGLAIAGAGLGILAAALAARSMTALLFGLGPFDPLIFAAVPAALVGVVLLASCPPARTAATADPLAALRAE